MMYKVKVKDQEFEVLSSNEGLTVNGSLLDWDFAKVSDGYFHIIYKNKSYRAEIVKQDLATKSFHIKVNGKIYPISVKDKFELLLETMGMNAGAASKVNSVKAPMPGLIIDLKVKAGDNVKAGDPLLILEAMKMENILKSPGDGTVKNVKVEKGNSVEKGQVLIEF